MRAVLFAVCVLAVGCGSKPTTEAVVEPKLGAKERESPAPKAEAPPKPEAPPKEAPKEKEKVTVEQYRKMCVGKTKEQVKDMLGKPDNTVSIQTGRSLWTYRGIVWNTESEKFVGLRIDFEADGVCFAVN